MRMNLEAGQQEILVLLSITYVKIQKKLKTYEKNIYKKSLLEFTQLVYYFSLKFSLHI